MPNWQETAVKEAANFTKFSSLKCKRGRKTTKNYDIGGNGCPYESAHCYFMFCYDGSYKKGHFAEWGCHPAHGHFDPSQHYNYHWGCKTSMVLAPIDMSNEQHTFEEAYEKYRKDHNL
ncbi:hypothetical protein niasHS_007776 [Heterodera schachtii]|uniref:Uncharacterized protein n=1 Tax=Heterodera schachtii TaxID=97005 RepID=A0ABD2JPL3_HETSC